MTSKKNNTNDQVDLTVGGLLRALQDIANRYGNDTPVALPSLSDADYEQATGPIVMHAKADDTTCDWTLFKIDPAGKTIVVIS